MLWEELLIATGQPQIIKVNCLGAGSTTAGPASKDRLEQKDRLRQAQAGRGAFGSRRSFSEKGVRGGDQGGVVMPARITAPLVVIEAELAPQLAVVKLDHPAQPGQVGQALGRGALGQVGEPVVALAPRRPRAIR